MCFVLSSALIAGDTFVLSATSFCLNFEDLSDFEAIFIFSGSGLGTSISRSVISLALLFTSSSADCAFLTVFSLISSACFIISSIDKLSFIIPHSQITQIKGQVFALQFHT